MKKTYISDTYNLSDRTIDVISEAVVGACESFRMDRKTAARYRISIEESLDVWRERLGENTEVRLETGSRMTRHYVEITAKGDRVNPYNLSEENYGVVGNSILTGISLAPVYSYVNGQNKLTFYIKGKQMNQFLQLVLIILFGVLAGFIGKALIPGETLNFLTVQIIDPVYETFFRVLSCIAGPMIFLSVAWGVYGIGDVYTLGRIGTKLLQHFMTVVFLFCAGGALFYSVLGPDITSASQQNSQFGKLFEMILGIFPSNIFSPFVDGNSLQIIFLAFIIGLSMIFLGQRTASIAKAVEQINYIINFLMNFISRMVPFFVFIVLVQIIWSGNLATFTKVWRFGLIFVAVAFSFIGLLLIFVGVKNRINPFIILKICLPSYLIALTTASSSATFESNMAIIKKKMGVSGSLASFGIPFGMVLFKPSTGLYYLFFCFYLSSVYNVSVTYSWIITAVFITAISAVATPPIPGGAAATYTLLFLQLGIPSEALAIALAVDMVFDFILTSNDMLTLLIELFYVSTRIDMQDMSVLKGK